MEWKVAWDIVMTLKGTTYHKQEKNPKNYKVFVRDVIELGFYKWLLQAEVNQQEL